LLSARVAVAFHVNGRAYERVVESRRLLVDFLRHELELHGTHVGCEQGVCGACTVLLDGEPVKSCLMLAPQVHGRSITTVEGLAERDTLHPVQQVFRDTHALQCGYCTPGFLLSAVALANRGVVLEGAALREELAGNLCRCTGYQNIVEAVERYLRQAAGGRRDG
jgi:carbon-monoxide dehydrogenase small subunit